MADDFARAAKKLRNLGPAIQGVLPGAVRAGALVFEPEVKQRAPVEDGDLQRSVGNRPVDSSANRASHQVHVSIFYAPFVEYGHGGPHPAPAHPFFRPAVDSKTDEAIKATLDIILRASRKATG